MNKQDVLNTLGEPDRITRGPTMVSDQWLCSTCAKLHIFAIPVRFPSSPCECGGIFYEKHYTLKTK